MKVMFVANDALTLRNFRGELLDSLLERGHEIILVLPYGEEIERYIEKGAIFEAIEMDGRTKNIKDNIFLLLQIRRIIGKYRPDKIITYTIKPNIFASLISRFYNIPVIVNITGMGTMFNSGFFNELFGRVLYKIAIQKAEYVIFENGANKTYFIEHNMTKERRSILFPGAGVNLDTHTFLDFPEKDTVDFLFAARIMKEKGIEELLEAFSRLSFEDKRVRLHIAGSLEEDYSDKISELSESGKLFYYGLVDDIRTLLKDVDCLVLPSYHEGMSNSILESASSGRAIIATNIHGCKEAVQEGVNGYLCESKSALSLYEAMKKFSHKSFDEIKNMGIASRQHMEKDFDRNMVVNKTIKLIEGEVIHVR